MFSKRFIVVGIFSAAVIFVAAAGWYFLAQRQSERAASLLPVAREAEKEKEQPALAPWDAACEGKSGSAWDACLSAYAVSRSALEPCEGVINPETRDVCASMALAKRAKCGGGIDECLAIPEENYREFCLLTSIDALAGGKDVSFCDTLNGEMAQARCRDGYAFRNIRAVAKDKTKCETMFATAYFRYACSFIQEWSRRMDADKDGDGLTHDAELRVGTSDSMADTDGDTYPDATEIARGYNALGPGKWCEFIRS